MLSDLDPVMSLNRAQVAAILTALESGAVVLNSDGEQLLLNFFAAHGDDDESSARFEAMLRSAGSTPGD